MRVQLVTVDIQISLNMVTATRRSEEHKSFLYSSFLIYLLEIQGNAVLSQR